MYYKKKKMEKEYIYLIWNSNGLAAIAKDNEKDLHNTILDCWSACNYHFDYDTIQAFIKKKEYAFSKYNIWCIERHPINALYENGTNL